MENSRKNYLVPLDKVKVTDRFWSPRIGLVSKEVIPYQWEALNDNIPGAPPSHAVENLRIAAGEIEGEYKGEFWQDSDLAKWLEAASFSLIHYPNPEIENKIELIIELLLKAQFEDGYINTYFTLAAPGKRFTNLRDYHELYCAGHLMEAAVAYYQATGKRKFLDMMCRYADLMESIFGTASGKKPGYDGHEEIELALVKLYDATGDEKYLRLSKFFIDERGKEPYYFETEAKERGEKVLPIPQHAKRTHLQAHLPVREQTTAEGHAVRLVYLCCGMADIAFRTNDEELFNACKRLWSNVIDKRMYITGGIGSMWFEEAFTIDYDLPNRRAYTETCAAIGMVLWAHRMLKHDPDSIYADVMERVLYNGVLSGISLDGKRYFYVNPLEVWPDEAKCRVDLQHVKTKRVPWYGCACCPPNIARMISSIGQYIYCNSDNEIYVHLYIGSKTEIDLNGQKIILNQENNYPWDGGVVFTIVSDIKSEFTLALRIPDWCKNPSVKVNGEPIYINSCITKGYAKITRSWSMNDIIELQLPMEVVRIQSHPCVRENSGKVALQRGPLVYCMEEVDNGANLSDISLSADAKFQAKFNKDLHGGIIVIEGEGLRNDISSWNSLYKEFEPKKKAIKITSVPYSYWGNRNAGEMLVWIRQES